jgi:hypoxanthine phosphoribosyltransferase
METAATTRAFILMPSGGHQEYEGGIEESQFVYDGIICPALARVYGNTVNVSREVDNRGPGAITRHIIQQIAEADVCIVDITGQNPNVFLELGVRYALRKATTILLKQANTTIPFDIIGYRHVDYSPRFHGVERAVQELEEALRIAIGRVDATSDSLVFEVYPQLLVSIPGVIEERGASSPAGNRMEWGEYMGRLAEIAGQLRDLFQNGRYVPDVILGISNGGLIYADLLGRNVFAGIPVQSLWANRPDRSGKFFENAINEAVIGGIKRYAQRDKGIEVLLVDDIVASGNTLQQAIAFLKANLPEASVHFLPMFSKNAATFAAMKDVFLWSSPLFGFDTDRMIQTHGSKRFMLPYDKELRST